MTTPQPWPRAATVRQKETSLFEHQDCVDDQLILGTVLIATVPTHPWPVLVENAAIQFDLGDRDVR